jgi:hypothetical protein
MRRLSDSIKVDIAIRPVGVTSSGTTSPYFKLDDYSRALFVWSVSPENTSTSVTLTSTGTLYQAKDASAATSAVAITAGTAIVSAATKAINFTATAITAIGSAADTLTITAYDVNGEAKTALVFYAVTTGTAAITASRQFTVNDTASGTAILSTAATNLAAILNNATYGVPGLYASATGAAVVCRAVDPGENMFTATSNNTTCLSVTINQAMGMLEIHASALTLSSNFTHVALNVVNDVSAITSAFIIRGGRRALKPLQRVGALTTVGE